MMHFTAGTGLQSMTARCLRPPSSPLGTDDRGGRGKNGTRPSNDSGVCPMRVAVAAAGDGVHAKVCDPFSC